jgi:hypothetical protein
MEDEAGKGEAQPTRAMGLRCTRLGIWGWVPWMKHTSKAHRMIAASLHLGRMFATTLCCRSVNKSLICVVATTAGLEKQDSGFRGRTAAAHEFRFRCRMRMLTRKGRYLAYRGW